MLDAARLLGWDADSPGAARNTRRRLQRLGEALGVVLLHRGGGTGNPSWTTFTALRHAGLVDDFGEAYRSIAPALEEHDRRLVALARHVRHLASVVARLVERLDALDGGTAPAPNAAGTGKRRRKRRRRRPDRLASPRRGEVLAALADDEDAGPVPVL